jgi:hypothetical protein
MTYTARTASPDRRIMMCLVPCRRFVRTIPATRIPDLEGAILR